MQERLDRIRRSLDGVGFDGDAEAGLRSAVREIVDLLEEAMAPAERPYQGWCHLCRVVIGVDGTHYDSEQHRRHGVDQPTLNHPVPCPDCTYHEPCKRARALEGTR